MGVVTHLKRKRVYLGGNSCSRPTDIDSYEGISSTLIFISSTEEATIGTSTRAGPKEFKDIFSQMVLGCFPFDFSIMIKKELIMALVGGKKGLEEAGINVLRALKTILIISSYVFVMFDENINCHINFNIGSYL